MRHACTVLHVINTSQPPAKLKVFCTNTVLTLKHSGWPLYLFTASYRLTQLQRILHKATTNTAFHSVEVGRPGPVTWFETEFIVVAVTMLLGVLYSNLPPDL